MNNVELRDLLPLCLGVLCRGIDVRFTRTRGFFGHGTKLVVVTLAIASSGLNVACAQESDASNWPAFRGANASGVAPGYPTATSWDGATGKNIKWKTRLAGLGLSSPIIFGDRLFVTTAVKEGEPADLKVGLYGAIQPVEDESIHDWRLLCLNRNTGKVLWDESVYTGVPKVKRHTKSSHANATPATDGKHLITQLGSEGLYCHDLDGKLIWKNSFGVLVSAYFRVPEAEWGFGSSPIIHDEKVIVQCDVIGDSFIAALDVATGEELWRTKRDEEPTWGSPTIYQHAGSTRIAVNGWYHMGGYDLETGKEVWKLSGGGDIPVPTPVVAHNLIYLMNAHGGRSPVYAVKTSAEGEIQLGDPEGQDDRIAWWYHRGGNYMQTPVVLGDFLYGCFDSGILRCYEAKTGEKIYTERLGGRESGFGFTASIVAADDKIYATSEDGKVVVIKAGPRFEVLSTNPLGEKCMATPAISGGVLFFRARHHLFAVGGG